MSTYRERRLARADRLREWAEKRAARSDGNFKRAHDLVKDIPFGQPILVGHYSEKRHRRTLEKSDNATRRAVEDTQAAESMSSRAANIAAAIEDAIYQDDPDRVERLEAKLAALEAQRERYKAENAAYRKGDAAYAALMGITVEQAAALRVKIEADYSWCRQPHPSYSLQNLGGTINKERKRLAQWKADTTRRGSATVQPTGETATARAGLVIAATMTTPRKSWKKPRPVWNVTGNLAYWRPLLVDQLGGSLYRGVVSFWDDPTATIERACAEAETPEPKTIWNSNGTDGPVLICPPPEAR